MSIIKTKDTNYRRFSKAKALLFTPYDDNGKLTNTTYDVHDIVGDTLSITQDDTDTTNIPAQFKDGVLAENTKLGTLRFSCQCIDFQNDIAYGLLGCSIIDDVVIYPKNYKTIATMVRIVFENEDIVLPYVKLDAKTLMENLRNDIARVELTGTAYSHDVLLDFAPFTDGQGDGIYSESKHKFSPMVFVSKNYAVYVPGTKKASTPYEVSLASLVAQGRFTDEFEIVGGKLISTYTASLPDYVEGTPYVINFPDVYVDEPDSITYEVVGTNLVFTMTTSDLDEYSSADMFGAYNDNTISYSVESSETVEGWLTDYHTGSGLSFITVGTAVSPASITKSKLLSSMGWSGIVGDRSGTTITFFHVNLPSDYGRNGTIQGTLPTLDIPPYIMSDGIYAEWNGSHTVADFLALLSDSNKLTYISSDSHAAYITKIDGEDYGDGKSTAVTIVSSENVTLEAVAATGYDFSQWNDGNTDNPRTVTPTHTTTYTATFVESSE